MQLLNNWVENTCVYEWVWVDQLIEVVNEVYRFFIFYAVDENFVLNDNLKHSFVLNAFTVRFIV